MCAIIAICCAAGCAVGSDYEVLEAPTASVARLERTGRSLLFVLAPGYSLERLMGFDDWVHIIDSPGIERLKAAFGAPQREWRDANGQTWSEFTCEGGVIWAGLETKAELRTRWTEWGVYYIPQAQTVAQVFPSDVADHIDAKERYLTVVVVSAGRDASAHCAVRKGDVVRCFFGGPRFPPPS